MASWPDPESVAADRYEWNVRTLVGAYDAVGTKDARWDATARRALTVFAGVRAGRPADDVKQVEALVKETLAAGCTDPFVIFLSLRFVQRPATSADAAAAQVYRDAADALARTSYPAVRKFYAALRAAQALRSANTGVPDSGWTYGPYRQQAFQELCRMLQEADTPAEEALDAVSELIQAIDSNATHKDEFLPTLIDYLGRRWPTQARARLLRGRAQVALAWNRRGTEYAQSVKAEGWKAFEEHLLGAEKDLEAAWKLDPTNAGIAVWMMDVELGQGRGRERMELWFGRAMKADPACYEAARAKVWYLQPKWHGSAAEAIAFGRECVNSTEWRGKVPLVLLDAHDMLANDRATGLKDAYWTQPGVWADVRASFERFFELNPEAEGWRHNYALYAHKCGQYGKFLDLVPTLGPVNYTFFGGRPAFEKMVAKAEKATGRRAEAPVDREGRDADSGRK